MASSNWPPFFVGQVTISNRVCTNPIVRQKHINRCLHSDRFSGWFHSLDAYGCNANSISIDHQICSRIVCIVGSQSETRSRMVEGRSPTYWEWLIRRSGEVYLVDLISGILAESRESVVLGYSRPSLPMEAKDGVNTFAFDGRS